MLLAGAFSLVACTPNEYEHDELDTETRIRQDFLNAMVSDNAISLDKVKIRSEYGTFNGYVVVEFYRFLVFHDSKMIDIGGTEFNDVLARHVVAWNDGEIFNIIEAFEACILSSADIKEISNLSNSIDVETRIRQDLFHKMGWGRASFDRPTIRNDFGIVNGYMVIEVNQLLGFPQIFIPVDVGGIIFDYTHAVHLIVWNHGEIFNIMEAYDIGILSAFDVQEIVRIRKEIDSGVW